MADDRPCSAGTRLSRSHWTVPQRMRKACPSIAIKIQVRYNEEGKQKLWLSFVGLILIFIIPNAVTVILMFVVRGLSYILVFTLNG